MPVFQLYTKRCVREVLEYLSLHLDDVILGHLCYRVSPAPPSPRKLAFFNSDSY
jgi:hypothetical protein